MYRITINSNNIRFFGSTTTASVVTAARSSSVLSSSSRYYCSSGNDQQHNQSIRVRYAPSPTGSLHLGGLRTALYNYLFAKKNNGTFILRIEDTDQTRLVQGSADNLQKCLEWAGIPYDEGPQRPRKEMEPYVQSERLPIYRKHAQQLIDNGHAYYCFCSHDRLEALKANSKGKGPVSIYDRHCLKLSKEEIDRKLNKEHLPHTIRLKIPHNQQYTKFDDIVKGNVQFINSQIDDQILLKSDGFPTYHLASVVDDHLMNISHVIRGEEWISSTPKHVILYDAFGWKKPIFAHVPLLLNKDKSKLSKRQGDVSVDSYINKGYLPEALVNFVAFLGWAPNDTNKEVFTLKELIESFTLEAINKAGSVVELDKLDWLNVQHIRLLMDTNEGMEKIFKQVSVNLINEYQLVNLNADYLKEAMKCVKDRVHKVEDFNQLLKPFYIEPKFDTEEAIKMKSKVWNTNSLTTLKLFIDKLENLEFSQYQTDKLYQTIQETVQEAHQSSGGVEPLQGKELTTKTNQLMSMIRYLLLGAPTGGGIPTTISVMGKSMTLDRLKRNFNLNQ